MQQRLVWRHGTVYACSSQQQLLLHHHHPRSAWKSKAVWPVLDATSLIVREAALRRTLSSSLKRCGHSSRVSALSLRESTSPASRESVQSGE